MKTKTILPFFALLILAAFIAVSCSTKTEPAAKEEVKVENKEMAMAAPPPPIDYSRVYALPANITFEQNAANTYLILKKTGASIDSISYNSSGNYFQCYWIRDSFYYYKYTTGSPSFTEKGQASGCSGTYTAKLTFGRKAPASNPVNTIIRGDDDNRATSLCKNDFASDSTIGTRPFQVLYKTITRTPSLPQGNDAIVVFYN